MAVEAYPLQWPAGRDKTPAWQRARATFRTTLSVATDELFREIRLLNGRMPVLSTQLQLRLDGLPYSNQRQPDDVGAAVYFTYKDKQMCFACDKWDKVEHNIQAVRKTIEALRGIARWGTGDMVQQAFSGFETLGHDSVEKSWREVFGVPGTVFAYDSVRKKYLVLRKEAHPDHGGIKEDFNRIQKAWNDFLAEYNA